MIPIEQVEKDHIKYLNLIQAEGHNLKDLTKKLEDAQRLGNEFKSKSRITFNTTIGPKSVSTTIWSVTEKYVQLKNNIHIPLISIIDIDF